MRSILLPALVWGALFAAAWWLAWALRYDFVPPAEAAQWCWATLPWVVALKIGIAVALRNSHEWMRYVSFRDLVLLAVTLLVAETAIVAAASIAQATALVEARIPPAVFVLDFSLSLLLVGAVRSLWRFKREHFGPLVNMLLRRGQYRPALLIGANRTGVVMANQIQFHPALRYQIIGFLDPDERLHGTRLGGIRVCGGLDQAARLARRMGAEDMFVLDGSLSGDAIRQLMTECQTHSVRLRVIANVYDLVNGPARGSRVAMREVDINDLLRRDPVALDDAVVKTLLRGKTILVTGAGGSIGSEICRQVLRFQPRKLLLVERAENALFEIHRELLALGCAVEIVPLVADVAEERRMRQVFEVWAPNVVFHAAAHKHVPMMESNPSEALANNVFGTKLTADLASEFGLDAFVLISTDKAVKPTSVMGLSKQIAERYVHALSQSSQTRFVAVRFGNVLGSAGSVVPIFKEQIRRGGPVTITHREMRRYFMTIPEASQLVLQAAAMGRGGEIFCLDMGEPIRIMDLARDLIRLSGLSEAEIAIVETGIRPGEKLYEELYFADEETLPTTHPKLRAAYHRPYTVQELDPLLAEIGELVREADAAAVHEQLRRLFPEFCESRTLAQRMQEQTATASQAESHAASLTTLEN